MADAVPEAPGPAVPCSLDCLSVFVPNLQTFFLTERHRAMLKEEEGVESWHFEQHAYEAVFIPAGCPHQVISSACIACILLCICATSPDQASAAVSEELGLQPCLLVAGRHP